MLGESDPSSASRKHAEPPPLPKSIVQPPPSIATAATSKPARPRRKLIILLSVAVALLIAVSVWALWHSHNKSPRASDYRMGAAYATGLGVPQDYAKALEWYRKGGGEREWGCDVRRRLAILRRPWRPAGLRQGNGMVPQRCGGGEWRGGGRRWLGTAIDPRSARCAKRFDICPSAGKLANGARSGKVQP